MAFVDVRLSTCVAFGFTSSPEWSTEVVIMDNGRTQRNAQWMFPKHRFTAQYMNLTDDLRDEVLKFFYAMRGQLHVFRFRDHNNDSGVGQPFENIGGVWRMVKRHIVGGETVSQLIQAPVEGEISLIGGSLVNLDFETGIYSGDASAITWTGTFDLWVRFANDMNAFAIENLNAHTANIELIEERR